MYLQATPSQAIAAAIYQEQNVSLLKDFVPIGRDGFVPLVPMFLPIKTVSELVVYLKAKPGNANFASQGQEG
ncbi:hypothetical protein EKL30_05825 [Candidimonas sp. SYP-B2681]|nr:hypothetical protein EKL30_05825 [Candidimonas sp. SYP-B2681]